MRKLRIGVLDLVTKSPNPSLYGRMMNANLASIMPQVIAVWCEQMGHDVTFVCYTGSRGSADRASRRSSTCSSSAPSPSRPSWPTRSATCSASAAPSRCWAAPTRGAIRRTRPSTSTTCWASPTRRSLKRSSWSARSTARWAAISPHSAPADRPSLASQSGGSSLEPTIAKAPTIKIVPMIGSLGCPYTCSFCIDSTVDYQPLGFEQLRDDLRFLLTKIKRPIVGLARPEFRRPVRRLHGGDRGSGATGPHPAHRREQPVAADRAAPQAAAEERLQGHPAGHRVVVRPGQQVEDSPHRHGEGGRRCRST